jgi:hypothetical protein
MSPLVVLSAATTTSVTTFGPNRRRARTATRPARGRGLPPSSGDQESPITLPARSIGALLRVHVRPMTRPCPASGGVEQGERHDQRTVAARELVGLEDRGGGGPRLDLGTGATGGTFRPDTALQRCHAGAPNGELGQRVTIDLEGKGSRRGQSSWPVYLSVTIAPGIVTVEGCFARPAASRLCDPMRAWRDAGGATDLPEVQMRTAARLVGLLSLLGNPSQALAPLSPRAHCRHHRHRRWRGLRVNLPGQRQANHLNAFDITRSYTVIGAARGHPRNGDVYRNTDNPLAFRLKYAYAAFTPRVTFKFARSTRPGSIGRRRYRMRARWRWSEVAGY